MQIEVIGYSWIKETKVKEAGVIRIERKTFYVPFTYKCEKNESFELRKMIAQANKTQAIEVALFYKTSCTREEIYAEWERFKGNKSQKDLADYFEISIELVRVSIDEGLKIKPQQKLEL